MGTRSEQLQIRVTRSEKATLKRLARQAGMDLSGYVLGRSLPSAASLGFTRLVSALRRGRDRKFVFAGLNDLLTELGPGQLSEAVAVANLRSISAFERNYVAAMVEHACASKRISPPAWTAEIAPLEKPWFATRLVALRLHLLRSSPVAFKKRNLFVDSTVGDRV